MIWILYSAIGAIFLGACNSIFRAFPGVPLIYLLLWCLLPTLGIQWGFGMAFRLAPTFVSAWFVGTALSALACFGANALIFHERVEFVQLFGISLVLGGAWILTK